MKSLLIIILVIFVTDLSNVFACTFSCSGGTTSEWFRGSAIVFEGKPVSVSSIEIPCSTSNGIAFTRYFLTFEVTIAWKGLASRQITIESSVARNCPDSYIALCPTFERSFQFGSTYIVFVQSNDGKLNSSICSPRLEPTDQNRKLLDSIVRVTTAVNQQNDLLSKTSVFPNPSKDFVNIAYSLDIVSAIDVTLFDMQGRQVQSIISEYRDAGNHSLSLDVSGLARGIYVCRLRLGNRTEVRQISVTG